MEYICLKCGHSWNTRATLYVRCPKCGSYDTAPACFWDLVDAAEKAGIHPTTPVWDILTAFSVCRRFDMVKRLPLREFVKLIRRVVQEVEKRREQRPRISVEPLDDSRKYPK